MPEAEDFDSKPEFLKYFARLDDPRQLAKVSYPLDEVFLLVLCAVISGADGWKSSSAISGHIVPTKMTKADTANKILLEIRAVSRLTTRVSDLLCMSNLAHASKLKEHDDNDDIQGNIRRAAERR